MQGRKEHRRSWGRLFSSFFPRPRVAHAEERPFGAEGEESGNAKPEEGPVQFENYNREWQNISSMENWDGFRIEAPTPVTKYLQAVHTLFLGTQMREQGYIYHFVSAFQSEDQRTTLCARAGLDGDVHARLVQKIGSSVELKASTNSHLKEIQGNVHEGSVDITGRSYTLQGKLAWQGAWLLGGAYMQQLTSALQLGGDLNLIGVNGITSIGQIGMRWAEGKDCVTGLLSRSPATGENLDELRLHYVRKVTDRLSLGTELKYTYPDIQSGMSLGYEYTLRQARIQGLLDTAGKVSCSIQDFTGFGFSGVIDYVKSDYKFGMVMHFLPQPEQPPP